jgi:hypothetical protein
MRLAVFQKYQNESDKPFMCYNKEHEMTLVPIINDDLEIELKCFDHNCGFSLKPGFKTYKEILDEQLQETK